jgi:hypothetical protein
VVGSHTVGMGGASAPPDVSLSAPATSATENTVAEGNAASTGARNAVTGEAALATPGNLGSSAQKGPKPSGVTKPPKSNDHATAEKPTIPEPAHVPSPTPKPEHPTSQSKPKYRGF